MAVSARDPSRLLDAWTLAFALVFVAVLAWRVSTLPHPALPSIVAGALVVLPLVAPRLRALHARGRFLGTFYPLLLAVAVYTAIGMLNTAAGTSHDAQVQAWEQRLFGAQPARDWIRAWPVAAVSNLLHLGYLSYYAILTAAPLVPWLRRDRNGAAETTLRMMAAFYCCYASFLLFPVAGPRYAFAHASNAATTAWAARATQSLLDGGAAWGTAFPSSHVAVSLVAAACAWRTWRPLGAALVPCALLLTLGTVYGQLHYAVDALAGATLAAIVMAWPGWPPRNFRG
jgi:membrane-associated phospholipid phosphatase